MKIKNYVIFITTSICIYSCRQVETLTPNLHFYLIFSISDNSEKMNVEVVKGTVNVVNTDIKNSVFDISLSGVRGGYSEFLRYKFIKINPMPKSSYEKLGMGYC